MCSLRTFFNGGSPYNVPAGHGAKLNEVIAHYQKKNAEQDAKARARADEIATIASSRAESRESKGSKSK